MPITAHGAFSYFIICSAHLPAAAALKTERFGVRHGDGHSVHTRRVAATVAIEIDAHILKELIEQSTEVDAEFLSVVVVERAYDRYGG